MKVIFAGTPEFARVALQSLSDAGFDIPLVLTQPDRPAGRGMKLHASPVKQWAVEHHIPVVQPVSLRLDGKYPDDAAAARQAIAAAGADVMVVAAYGIILPSWVLDAPRLGCINIHASLLPRWRGAAPIHRAIEAGDTETGITIMQMDQGLDTGDMLLVERVPILAQDTTESLHDRLSALGARLAVEALEMAACGGLRPMPQPTAGVSYARKIEKHEALLDWAQPAAVLERRIRAFNPFPGPSGLLAGSNAAPENIKFREAVLLTQPRPALAANGEVIAAGDKGIDICASDGVLRAVRLQKAGGKALEAAHFLRGFEIRPGMVFEPPAPDLTPSV